MEKSYVTMEVCPICKEDTGSILMDRRMRDSFERRTINPSNPCEKCRGKYLKEGILVINPNTGSLVVLKDSAFERMFNKTIPKQRIAFTDINLDEWINKIKVSDSNES